MLNRQNVRQQHLGTFAAAHGVVSLPLSSEASRHHGFLSHRAFSRHARPQASRPWTGAQGASLWLTNLEAARCRVGGCPHIQAEEPGGRCLSVVSCRPFCPRSGPRGIRLSSRGSQHLHPPSASHMPHDERPAISPVCLLFFSSSSCDHDHR